VIASQSVQGTGSGLAGYYRHVTMMPRECDADLGPAVALFRSLGDPTRLAIVHELARGERRVVDLTRSLSLAQSTISGHLACLAGCQLVTSRAVGRQSFYRLTQPDLIGVLGAAERLLAATGSAVALCPTYSTNASGAATGTSA
jgi:DNA-binding transcriptional ArsR family regulator